MAARSITPPIAARERRSPFDCRSGGPAHAPAQRVVERTHHDPAIDDGLIALLSSEPDVTVVGSASDAASADRLIAAASPDVVLCDVRLAGGADGLAVLARHTPGPAFIMLTAYVYPSYYVAATEGGARGYISKMATIQ